MSSDRNLMQFIFNHLLISKLDRQSAGSRYFVCLGLFLIIGLVSNTVSGQDMSGRLPLRAYIDGFEIFEPHQFGDTPSPTEMLARLKYHKHQETPLFDLLREAGVDIFSKLSDDEKKLAGRFVEDMILKEGFESEKVSSLMEKMNIGDEARKALQEGIERAGVDESAISTEQRKELADKIRKDFLQRSDSLQDAFKSPTNQNWQPPALTAEREALNKALNDRREELGLERINPGSSAAGDRERELARQQSLRSRSDEARAPFPSAPSRTDDQNNPPSSFQDNLGGFDVQAEARKLHEQRRSRELAGPATSTNPHFPQPEPNRQDRATQTPNRGFPDNTNPPSGSFQGQPARQALNKIESQLNEPQRKIVSEFKNRIQRGDISRQEIGELLRDLKKPKTSSDFARQLDEVGEKLDLPAGSREEIQQAFSELSRLERSSLQQAFDEVDEGLLTELANGTNQSVDRGSDARPPNSTATRPSLDNSQSMASQIDNILNEQLGKEFLKEALETYNDTESGYKLSPAFKQLKDRAEGKGSDREMANLGNFGNLSKRLFEDSSNIFDPDATSNSRRPNGVKPGQRFDQILAAAAEKALDSQDGSDDENKSYFSNVLDNALGAALDQALDIADKDGANRNQDVPEGWDQWSQTPSGDFNLQGQSNSFENPNNTQADSPSNSTPNQSASSVISDSKRSIDSAAASIADSVSKFEFDWRTLAYAVGLIVLFAGAVFLLYRLIPTADESVRKQRELHRKLQSNLANPKDVVEAVDLFLLSRFGAASSWWNAKHAADKITTSQPDWRDKVVSLFQVYRWSRYQADGNASVSAEQNELVNSTLKELSQAIAEPLSAAAVVVTPKIDLDQPFNAHDEATS